MGGLVYKPPTGGKGRSAAVCVAAQHLGERKSGKVVRDTGVYSLSTGVYSLSTACLRVSTGVYACLQPVYGCLQPVYRGLRLSTGVWVVPPLEVRLPYFGSA